MRDLSQRDSLLIFVPSVKDIEDYDGDDRYYCGLAEVRYQVEAIPRQLEEQFCRGPLSEKRQITRIRLPSGEPGHGYWPDFIFELVLIMATGTTSAALYKLIDSWISYRNGRKLRIRLPNGFEVEASQLTEAEFERLFQYLYSKYGPGGTFDAEGGELRRLGFQVVSSAQLHDELQSIELAYDAKSQQLKQRAKSQAGRGEA